MIAAAVLALFMTEPYVDSEKFTVHTYIAKLQKGVKALATTSYTLWLSVYYVIMAGVSWSCLYYFNNPFAADVGYTEIGQSYLYSALYIITTGLLLFITSKKKLLDKKLVFTVYPIILLVGLLPGIWAGNILAAVLLMFVILAGGARFSILHAFVNEEIDSSHRATSLSMLSLLVSLFCAVLIGGLGWVQQQWGTPLVFTILGVIVAVFGLPATYAVIHYQTRHKV